MRRVASCAVVCAIGTAHAGPTTLTVEGGAEADTNVQRIETGPGLTTERVAAPVGRFGAKIDHRGRLWGGGYSISASTLARVVLQDRTSGDEPDTSPENIALLSGDLRWMRPIGKRAASAGLALTAVDAVPISDAVGARTFRTLGADALLLLRGSDDRALSFAFGWRNFNYKPIPCDPDPPPVPDTEQACVDWRGPTASARLDLTLWQPAGGTRSLELALTLGFEARSYDSFALATKCPDDAPPDTATCTVPTALTRRDRFQRGGLELIWTGRVVAAVGYQIGATDSNSYGQSLLRHRVTVSATTNLPWRLVGTALGTLQVDQYLDGLIVVKDLQHATFTTLDDENRSSLQLRLARQLSRSWAVESRAAIWRDLGGNVETTFRRALLYVGAVYNR